jgi:hypothetical protein
MTQTRRMRWTEHAACRDLVKKPEGKTLLGRFTRKWDDNIKMYLKLM